MFPALIIVFYDRTRIIGEINPFEPGIWMLPILISNSLIFATIILYRKNKLPQKITNLFRFIFNFEIPHRISLVLVGILIASYAILNVGGLYDPEPWGDYLEVVKILEKFSFVLLVIPIALDDSVFADKE